MLTASPPLRATPAPILCIPMVRIKSILSKFRAAFPEAELGTILAP